MRHAVSASQPSNSGSGLSLGMDRDGKRSRITETGELADELRNPFGSVGDDEYVVPVASPVAANQVAWRSFHVAPPKAEGLLRSGVGRSWCHAGRAAAGDPGSLHPDAEALPNAANLRPANRKVGQ
jgi:hypothetical protein